MSSPTILTVNLGARSYPIYIGAGILKNAGEIIAKQSARKRVFVITDQNVEPHYREALEKSMTEQGIVMHTEVIAPGEASKTMLMVDQIMEWIFEYAPERGDVLIALGGGVIGDITGFVASIVLRGIKFIQIPTTLLAMVDSSVGGKTGVNNQYGKNLIGSFYQPCAVLIDTNTLKTLPPRELRAGYAEIVKYGLIKDKEFFIWLETEAHRVLARDGNALIRAIHQSASMKAAIVGADERESGERALLNLGHTFGHALEKAMGYTGDLLHGEAVSIGMALAFGFAASLGKCSKEDAQRVKAHLEKTGLPTELPPEKKWKSEGIIEDMFQDKKVQNGQLVLILPRSIGEAYIEKTIEESALARFLATHCA